ncbi:Vacuolar ATPase assembly integral membrane protein VMA21-like domain protein [Ascosphaera apis ARSEF 7405]|uniref:Vacuolar ATPase assembly integral membrane protein VMA21-like domain protein n=1 Tax=Ascosphaera apis ARSEF 7405 TaxID=392613 RepID=A0A167UUZ0_9EURO|nr:Vacuolar ATPase assembly integral membrane protein VMA21-like domain protein [Ascosphaera apis ARSEF 7405]
MATRRTTAKKDTQQLSEKDSSSVSDISPAVPVDVIYKLLGFTIAMFLSPLVVYFFSRDLIFGGNATFAGGAAAVAANVVLVAYLIVAWKDDKEEREHMTAGQIKKTE